MPKPAAPQPTNLAKTTVIAARSCGLAIARLAALSSHYLDDIGIGPEMRDLSPEDGTPEELDARLDDVQPIRSGHCYVIQFQALYQLRRYEEAAQAMAHVAHPDDRQRIWAAAIAAQLGREDEVRRELDAVAADAPDCDHLALADRSYHSEKEGSREHMLEGIRKALSIWREG